MTRDMGMYSDAVEREKELGRTEGGKGRHRAFLIISIEQLLSNASFFVWES